MQADGLSGRGGVWTIGYGDTENVKPGMVITQAEAEERLVRRLACEFEPGVTKALKLRAEQFPRWDKAGRVSVLGLRRRRAAERALFLGVSVEKAIQIGEGTP